MKYIKKYEKIIFSKKPPFPNPRYGHYVICHEDSDNIDVNNFLANNVGKIIGIRKSREPYVVQFENVPANLAFHFSHPYKNTLTFHIREIDCWSTNKKELEDYIIEKKYNL